MVAREYSSTFTLPSESSTRNWRLCDYPGCGGEATPNRGRCIVHLDDGERADYLRAVGRGEAILTLSGLTIPGPLFAAVLAAMPQTRANPSGQLRPVVPSSAFLDETRFPEYLDAQHVTFAAACSMTKATFEKGVIWNGSRFGDLTLRGATIQGRADFSNVLIGGTASWAAIETTEQLSLVRGVIERDLDLRFAKCAGVWLSYTRIDGQMRCEQASFDRQDAEEAAAKRLRLGRFDGVQVRGPADLTRVTFPYETTFGGYADMSPATFEDSTKFTGSTFGDSSVGGRHLFSNLSFPDADFSDCTFYGRVSFASSTFANQLLLLNLRVVKPTAAQVEDQNARLFPRTELDLTNLSARGGARLINPDVEGSIAISFVSLDRDLEIEGLRCTERLTISDTTFGYLPIEVALARAIVFRRCQFSRGGIISCPSSDISLIECDARQPTVVSSAGDAGARLISLDRTNVEHLVLYGMDLSATEFAGVNNLDKLRIQGPPRFVRAPGRIGTRRQVVQDEIVLRARRSERWRELLSSGESSIADPQVVAAVYRALRKNREDSKDEPGGADFYYGEMEMRRAAAPSWSAEGILLFAYWLTSGYALRAWRALATLTLLIFAGATLWQMYGFASGEPDDLASSVLLFAQTSLALARLPEDLTDVGVLIAIAGRIVCPLLLALAVLALRSRVKR